MQLLWHIPIVMGVLLVAGLLMGQRQMAELNVFDLYTGIAIGSVAGAGLVDPSIHYVPVLICMAGLACLHLAFSWATAKWRWFGRVASLEPTVIVQNGVPLRKALLAVRLTLSDLMPLLREQQVFDLREVAYAIFEPDGHISIIRTDSTPKREGLPRAVIVDGHVEKAVLSGLGWTEEQLLDALRQQGFPSAAEVFLAMMDEAHRFYVVPMNAPQEGPALRH